MSLVDREARNAYVRNWKERNRRLAGIPKKEPASLEERKEKQRLAAKKYRESHSDKINANRKEYVDKNPVKRLLWAAKKRAKEKELPFNLTEDDIIIPEHCPYLGIALRSQSDRGDSRTDICSLDRIIPELGYVRNNVEVISHLANTMKSNATKEQLIAFSTEVLRRYTRSS